MLFGFSGISAFSCVATIGSVLILLHSFEIMGNIVKKISDYFDYEYEKEVAGWLILPAK